MNKISTPRLCIDGRAAEEFPLRGLVAQDAIDQLVSAIGQDDYSNQWMEKQRTVLLTHPGQVFTGQLKRHETRWKIGRAPWDLLWERYFERNANVTAFHRFRPIDRLSRVTCPTITTLLPPEGKMPLFVSRRRNQQYVVPSQGDGRILEKQYKIDREHIHSLTPSVRRYVFFTNWLENEENKDGCVLILVDDPKKKAQLEKLKRVIALRYPRVPISILTLKDKNAFSPTMWLKHLSSARVFFYLVSQPFDWAILALESLFWHVPTVFADENRALSELLPQSSLKLSSYLVNQPDATLLKAQTEVGREALQSNGVFEPLLTAKAYARLYETLPTLGF